MEDMQDEVCKYTSKYNKQLIKYVTNIIDNIVYILFLDPVCC